MVGTWLLELYLDQLNRSLLDVEGTDSGSTQQMQKGSGDTAQNEERQTSTGQGSTQHATQLTERLRSFLKRNVEVLDVNVTVSLLAGYGRLDDLMEYATYRKVSAQASPVMWYTLLCCIYMSYLAAQRVNARRIQAKLNQVKSVFITGDHGTSCQCCNVLLLHFWLR